MIHRARPARNSLRMAPNRSTNPGFFCNQFAPAAWPAPARSTPVGHRVDCNGPNLVSLGEGQRLQTAKNRAAVEFAGSCAEAYKLSRIVTNRRPARRRGLALRGIFMRRRRISQTVVAHLVARQEGLCALCGANLAAVSPVHIDHIIPRRAGGTDEEDNLQAVCGTCNVEKGGALLRPEDGPFRLRDSYWKDALVSTVKRCWPQDPPMYIGPHPVVQVWRRWGAHGPSLYVQIHAERIDAGQEGNHHGANDQID